jgi:transitional endoplasmic reticulum ATPase
MAESLSTNGNGAAREALKSYPKWVQQFYGLSGAGSAHMFLVHGEGVDDYVVSNQSMRSFLEGFFQPDQSRTLAKGERHRLLVFYNRARGISFGLNPASHEARSTQIKTARNAFEQAIGRAEAAEKLQGLLPAKQATGDGTKLPDLEREPAAVMPLFDRLLSQEKVEVVLVIEAAETLCPSADFAAMSPEDRTMLVLFRSWGQDLEIGLRGHTVLVVTGDINTLHPSLREATSGVRACEVPLPGFEKRLEFIEALVAAYTAEREAAAEKDKSEPCALLNIDTSEFAGLGAGLPFRGLEEIILRADFEEQPVTRELVIDRKKEMIAQSYGDVIEILDPERGFDDVGGLEHVKEWFRKSVIAPIRDGNTKRAKKGALLAGPAGTGKTKLAAALAYESGVNCVVLNPALILGHWVGQSERSMRRALNLIRSLGRCIVFVDELDALGFNRSSEGDSGVGSRLFKQLMEFMADEKNRGRIFFLGATNRPDLLDAAMIRDGRFDKKIPILPPTGPERVSILNVMVTRYLDNEPAAETIQWVAGRTDRWTGAELESLVLKAWEILEDERAPNIQASFELALQLYRPTTGEIAAMSREAIKVCNDYDLLPPELRAEADAAARSAAQSALKDDDETDDEDGDGGLLRRRRSRRNR